MTEVQIEKELIDKLTQLKYIHRPDIHDRQSQAKFMDEREAHRLHQHPRSWQTLEQARNSPELPGLQSCPKTKELANLATAHALKTQALQDFVEREISGLKAYE
jgi:hypothetical protein